MRKTLKVVAFGGDPADAFLKAAGITDATITSAVKTLVRGLQADGLWSKMLGIYPLVGGTASSHAWNLKDTTKLKIRWVGGMTHDSTGVTGNGTNSYGQPDVVGTTGINAINYPPLTATNYGISSYQRTTSVEYVSQIGFGYTTGYVLHSYGGGTTHYFRGITASPDNATNANKVGLIQMYGGSGVGSGFINGTKIVSGTGGVLPNTALNTYLWFAGNNGGGYSNRNFSFFTVSQYLSDTEASNLYTRIQTFQTSLNRFVGTPIYPSFDSDAQSFMTSASITDSTQQAAVNYLVTDLKSANLWSKMKAIYPMVGGTASSHSYNLKNPSQFQITWNGGLTHSSNGVLPNGTTGYGNTNFNPSSNITTNSAHHSFYFKTNRSIYQTAVHGAYQSNQLDMALYPYAFNIGWINDIFDNSTSRLTISTGDSTGYVIGTRSSSSSHKLFRNNTQIASTTSATTGTPPNANYFIGALNYLGSANYFDNNQIAMATIGDGLTDTDASNLYTIIQNYQTILSRQV
jgi:hypothetical protein